MSLEFLAHFEKILPTPKELLSFRINFAKEKFNI